MKVVSREIVAAGGWLDLFLDSGSTVRDQAKHFGGKSRFDSLLDICA